MMRLGIAGLVLCGLLLGCGQADKAGAPATEEALDSYASRGMANAPAPTGGVADQAQDARAAPTTATTTTLPTQGGGTASPVLYLAYSYSMDLELPPARLIGVMDAHVRACQSAGPALCQLISSQRSGDPANQVSGTVQLRAEPRWIARFIDSASHDADAAGGRVTSKTTTAEDLTRFIVDTEATQRAQLALRDRLQRLLDSHPGRLADLLQVESELARVQGEIDARQSELTVARTRVSMSTLTLNYQSTAQPLSRDTFKPLGDAFANFLSFVVVGFAAIITLIAVVLPWLIVGVPLVWLLLRWRRRRGGRFFRRHEPPPPAANA